MDLYKTALMSNIENRKEIREQNYRGVPKLIQSTLKSDALRIENGVTILFPAQFGSSVKSLKLSSESAVPELVVNLGVYYSNDDGEYIASPAGNQNPLGNAVNAVLEARETKELLTPLKMMKTVYELLEPNPVTDAFISEIEKYRKKHSVYIGMSVSTKTTAAADIDVYVTAEVVESAPSCSQWKGEVMGERG